MNIGQLLIIGVAAWFLFGKKIVDMAAQTGTPVIGNTTGLIDPLTQVAVEETANTLNLMEQARQTHGLGNRLTFDQWNYLYSLPNVRGVSGPAYEDIANGGRDRLTLISLQEWYSMLGTSGVSGLGRIGQEILRLRAGGLNTGESSIKKWLQ